MIIWMSYKRNDILRVCMVEDTKITKLSHTNITFKFDSTIFVFDKQPLHFFSVTNNGYQSKPKKNVNNSHILIIKIQFANSCDGNGRIKKPKAKKAII